MSRATSSGRGLGLICTLAAIVIFFAPFLFQGRHIVPFHFERSSATGIPEGGDAAALADPWRWKDSSPILLHYPNAALAGEYLRRGHLPTWNPYVGCGTPSLGNGQTYPFSPFLWPFYLFPDPWVFTAGLMLGCLFGAWGIYRWLGRFDLDPWQRGFGTALFVINPWTVRLIVYSSVWAAWWIGWLLWAWDRTLDREDRRWWLPAMMMAGMVYCGHPETALLLSAGSLAYACMCWIALPKGHREWTFWPKAAGAVGLAGMLTAVHWMPVLARLGESLPYKVLLPTLATSGQYPWNSLLNPRTEVYLSPFLLALAALGFMSRARALWAPAVLLAGSVVFLFHPIPMSGVYTLLTLGGVIPPFYGRSLFWVALIPLAAAGAGSLIERGKANKWRCLAALAVGVAPYLIYFGGGSASGLIRWEWVAYCAAAFSLLGLAVVVRSRRARALLLAAGLIFVVLDPFTLLRGYQRLDTPFAFVRSLKEPHYSYFNRDDPLRGGPPALRELRSLPGVDHARFWAESVPAGAPVPSLSPNLAALWRVRDVRVTDVLLGQRYVVLQESMKEVRQSTFFTSLPFSTARPDQLGLLGVRYLGRSEGPDKARFTWEPVPDPLPRAFLTHRVVAAQDEEDSAKLWGKLLKENRLREETILEGWGGGDRIGHPSDGEKVSWLEDGLSRVRLKVETSSDAALVLLDAYAEGWEARIDGSVVSILPADLAFRAVVVPAGDHEVDFRYAPRAAGNGLALAGAGWALIVLLAVVTRRRSRP